jgi:hypothetical protein
VSAGQSDVELSQTQTRSSKRLHTSQIDAHNVQEPTDAHDDILDSSTPRVADHEMSATEEDIAFAADDTTGAHQDIVSTDAVTEGKLLFSLHMTSLL